MTVGRRITKDFEIECLSPVHIGSGDKLTAAEYIFDEKARQVYFVDQAQWIQFLFRKKLTDEFSRYIERTAEQLGRKGCRIIGEEGFFSRATIMGVAYAKRYQA